MYINRFSNDQISSRLSVSRQTTFLFHLTPPQFQRMYAKKLLVYVRKQAGGVRTSGKRAVSKQLCARQKAQVRQGQTLRAVTNESKLKLI
jgi:hypothetical protein